MSGSHILMSEEQRKLLVDLLRQLDGMKTILLRLLKT